ncbi:hypothetical protein HanRHA438_Chr02g0086371 [Helianthus annuus]|nr:hypothetical protein HanIR_Chr02g0087641 [Helianthus annuus]KAJ0940701.1 hypothetical protein HanRHA438_Chr02g0086371 [Helianthus annuus]
MHGQKLQLLKSLELKETLIFGLFLQDFSLFCGHFGDHLMLVSCRIFFDNSCMRKP